jgi:prepilin-type N-terminal cleavage/methylation domain-containing protein
MTKIDGTTRIMHDERGFSLVEVLVAIVILTVGLLSLAQMMVLSTNANTLSGRMTSCAALAKEQLERLKAAPFYTPGPPARNPLLVPGGDPLLETTVGGYSQFYDVAPPNLPLEMVRIDMRCLAAAGDQDQFAVIGDARFTTFRTANVR